jgi:hypothetical protein
MLTRMRATPSNGLGARHMVADAQTGRLRIYLILPATQVSLEAL